MDKVFLPFYFSWGDRTRDLSNEEFGKLVRGLLLFSETGEIIDGFSPMAKMAYEFMVETIQRSQVKSEVQRENANKRWNKCHGNATAMPRQCQQNATAMPTQCNGTTINTNTNINTNINTISPPTPSPGEKRFDEFWEAYPKKVGKAYARKCFMKIAPSRELLDRMLSAIDTQKRSPEWQRDNGQYIPNPSTWLNQGRWDDEPMPAAASRPSHARVDSGAHPDDDGDEMMKRALEQSRSAFKFDDDGNLVN